MGNYSNFSFQRNGEFFESSIKYGYPLLPFISFKTEDLVFSVDPEDGYTDVEEDGSEGDYINVEIAFKTTKKKFIKNYKSRKPVIEARYKSLVERAHSLTKKEKLNRLELLQKYFKE